MSAIMKSLFSAKSIRAVLILALALVASHLSTHASLLSSGVDLGYADHTPTDRWAVFTLGAGAADVNVMSSGASIWGDVGFAGSGKSNLSGTGSIRGEVVSRSTGTMAKSSTFTVTGSILNNRDADLAQGVTDARNASTAAFGMAASAGYPTTINTNTSLTLNDTTASHTVVLQLTDFVLSETAALTLQGTAATTYIINVTNKFSLSGTSVVQLSGGLTADNVLFNVIGTGDATMSSSAVLNGIVLAADRTMKMSGSATVYGQVIANKVSLAGVSSVRRPISP